jgi:hypothetical protein
LFAGEKEDFKAEGKSYKSAAEFIARALAD